MLPPGALPVATGCPQGNGEPEADEARNRTVEAMGSVETYAFETETDVEAEAAEGDTPDSPSAAKSVEGPRTTPRTG